MACAGGLTTALMLGHLAASGRSGVHAAAFMITMIETSEPSLIQALSTERVRQQLSEDAAAKRIYDQKTMASNFAWMRPNDLIFNYVANNWLMGNDPPAFDILAWNAIRRTSLPRSTATSSSCMPRTLPPHRAL